MWRNANERECDSQRKGGDGEGERSLNQTRRPALHSVTKPVQHRPCHVSRPPQNTEARQRCGKQVGRSGRGAPSAITLPSVYTMRTFSAGATHYSRVGLKGALSELALSSKKARYAMATMRMWWGTVMSLAMTLLALALQSFMSARLSVS